MKVLVTGHLGYIGCVLTPMLVERGHTVHGIDSDLYRKCTFFGSVALLSGVKMNCSINSSLAS